MTCRDGEPPEMHPTTEWNAAAYHQINSLQQWMAEESLSTLKVRGDETALDVGCGDGRVTEELSRRLPGGSILGVDPSTKMIEYAQKTYPDVKFAVADARNLGLTGFDLVVSFNALHWVPRPDFPRAMDSLRQALKPGGRALLRFVGKGPRPALEVVVQETAADHAGPFTHFTLDEFYQLAKQHGFSVDSMSLLDRHWDFPPGGFARWARTTFVPWTEKMSDPEPFIARVLQSYEPLAGRPERFAFYQMVSELVAL